jgi:hypothetical protein
MVMGEILSHLERKIIVRLRAKIDPDRRMTKHELIRYCIRWVGVRLNHDLIWREDFETRRKRPRDWAPEELALLGTMTDCEVARRIKRHPGAVRLRRVQLDIPRYLVKMGRPPPLTPNGPDSSDENDVKS